MKKVFFIPGLLFAAFGSFSQTPGVRNGHNMVYYPPLKCIILFGGATESKVCGDTWSYTKNKWAKLADSGPSPRTFPAMVMADGYILLFGGNAVLFGSDTNPVHYLDDTWKFENGVWKKVVVGLHPGARAETAMAYDPIRKKIVLFGGREAGEKWITGDTWEFDGKHWREVDTSGPTPRSGAAMVYDPERKQVVLFGGNPVIEKEKDYNGPMWSWDGRNWHQMNSRDPLIFNSCMAYNTTGHYILRFGGWNGEKRVNDTWTFQHDAWIKLHPGNAPEPRNHSVMVYDALSNSFILYGGHDGDNVFGDMWSFKNMKWERIIATPPLLRVANGH